jgi:hypothetical protein
MEVWYLLGLGLVLCHWWWRVVMRGPWRCHVSLGGVSLPLINGGARKRNKTSPINFCHGRYA